MHDMRTTFIASAFKLMSSDLFLSIETPMFTSPSPNANGVRVSKEFISEIVEHKDNYIGLTLCADVTTLLEGQYDNLSHLYDPNTDTFGTIQIGSFVDFAIEKKPDGELVLIGHARVEKRYKGICQALSNLFSAGKLKFSFEIATTKHQKLDDGTILLDVGTSQLEGMCVVSFPACEEAVARQLVAEMNGLNLEAEHMENENTTVVETAEVITPEAETQEHIAEAEQTPVADTQVAETEQEAATVNAENECAPANPAEPEESACTQTVEENGCTQTDTENTTAQVETPSEPATVATHDWSELVASVSDAVSEQFKAAMETFISEMRSIFASQNAEPEETIIASVAEEASKPSGIVDNTVVDNGTGEWSLLRRSTRAQYDAENRSAM